MSILKWLPANRAAISFPAAVNDKTRGLVLDQHAVLRSMMGTSRRAGLWVRGGFSREDRNPLATDRRRDAVARLRPLAARASCRKGAMRLACPRLDGVSPKPTRSARVTIAKPFFWGPTRMHNDRSNLATRVGSKVRAVLVGGHHRDRDCVRRRPILGRSRDGSRGLWGSHPSFRRRRLSGCPGNSRYPCPVYSGSCC